MKPGRSPHNQSETHLSCVRIAFITSRFPFPVEKGDKLRAFHQIRELSKRHEVHLISISHHHVPEKDLQAMQPYCGSIRVFVLKWYMRPLHILLGLMEGMPFQVSFFADRLIKRHIHLHIINIEPDHLICQLIRAAEYVRALPFPKTLDYMDVFSEGMRQMAVRQPLLSFFFNWESKRLAAYERTLYKDFDHHIIISGQDRDRLKLPTREHVTIIPNGVDTSFLHFTSGHTPSYDIVFIGNLGYGPNKYAVQYLTGQILPLLIKAKKDIRILIAGARPGNLTRKWKGHKNVTIRGWVEDIREAYCDGRIFVAPMFSGLGLQNKILEAMALGLPCITTSMVNNAIQATAGQEILVADDANEMAAHIIRLLENPQEYIQLAEAGKIFVTRHFNWEEQVLRMEEVIQKKNPFYVK